MKKSKMLMIITVSVLIAIVAYFLFSYIYTTTKSEFIIEVNNAIIGVIFGGIVTVFLLSQQSSSEEVKEKNVEIFKMKSELYNKFFDVLWDVWEDEKLDEEEIRIILRLLKRISLYLDDKSTEKLSELVNALLKLYDKDSLIKNNDDVHSHNDIKKYIENIFADITLLLRYDLGMKGNRRSKKKILEIETDIFSTNK